MKISNVSYLAVLEIVVPSLPHLNQNENDHHESKNYLTQNAMQIIKDIYWEDYERFGYGHVLNYKTLDIIND